MGKFNIDDFKKSNLYNQLTSLQKSYVDNALNVAISYQEDNNSTKQILDDFGKRFQDKGVLDVKSKSIKEGNITNEYLGNFIYGVFGTIAGIEDKFLISAGAAQQVLHNKKIHINRCIENLFKIKNLFYISSY